MVALLETDLEIGLADDEHQGRGADHDQAGVDGEEGLGDLLSVLGHDDAHQKPALDVVGPELPPREAGLQELPKIVDRVAPRLLKRRLRPPAAPGGGRALLRQRGGDAPQHGVALAHVCNDGHALRVCREVVHLVFWWCYWEMRGWRLCV